MAVPKRIHIEHEPGVYFLLPAIHISRPHESMPAITACGLELSWLGWWLYLKLWKVERSAAREERS